jgi:hypothetical protein
MHLAEPSAWTMPIPLPTAATAAFLRHPVLFYRRTARDVLLAVAQARCDATAERRAHIEAMLERLENLRERLVAKLDAMDGDPDLEPWLGRPECACQMLYAQGGTDDREDASEDLEENGDREPLLGSTAATNQLAWAMGGSSDLEDEHDGCEPEGWS